MKRNFLLGRGERRIKVQTPRVYLVHTVTAYLRKPRVLYRREGENLGSTQVIRETKNVS